MARTFLLLCIATALLYGCFPAQDKYLVRIWEDGTCFHQLGERCGYVNEKGDTVIPFGKYYACYDDTIRRWGTVITNDGKCVGIDYDENILFRIMWCDNGPDHVSDGLFRVVGGDGSIGYSDEQGNIVIPPQYKCAYPFKGGRARVAFEGDTIEVGEYKVWESDQWFYIDKNGNILK